MALRWTSISGFRIAFAGIVLLLCAAAAAIDGSQAAPIGVNWGDMARQPLAPEVVVKLLQSNNISRVKLFDTKAPILEALSGTGIEVMVGAPNSLLPALAAPGGNGEQAAADWVAQNLTRFLRRADGGVKIRYVAVGNEPFYGPNNATYGHLCLPALRNVQKAIGAAGLGGKVFATVPFSADVLDEAGASPDPSSGAFRPDIAAVMRGIVASYVETSAPFCVNLYPFINLVYSTGFPSDFAFFGAHSSRDSVTNLTYHSVFDAMFDRVVSALATVGAPALPIVVGEVGWPTDGNPVANVSNAQRFNNELLAHVANGSGSPLRPDEPFDIFLFGLLDENLKDLLDGITPYERHWGIFLHDGTPKYPIDLSGRGDSGSWPKAAVGVKHLDRKFCVLSPNLHPDPVVLGQKVDFACAHSDCSALQVGGSCSGLNSSMIASYAFNNYFQFNYQQAQFCNVDTLGMVVTTDPSTERCKFPLGLDYPAASSRSLLIARGTIFSALFPFLLFLVL
ncbi:glucan endo-1,3-beta-glucosidase 5/6 [Marchantia polymorpha subsp. ruderalis]